MGWKIPDKITVAPQDDDLVPFDQGGILRKSTWEKIKEYILGTATLITTDKTIKGAINENTAQLSEIVPNTTLWYLENVDNIRTRAIVSSQGFYNIDDDAYCRYRVVMIDGTETWTTITVGSYSFKISNDGEIAPNKTLTTSNKKLKYIQKHDQYNVKCFGAVGDGITDDTEIIRHVLKSYTLSDMAQGSTTGKETGRTIYLPANLFLITAPLYLRRGDKLKGAGMTKTKILCKTNISYMLKIGHVLINNVETLDSNGLLPEVEDICFVETVGIKAIDINNQAGFRINRCWFFADIGINIYGTTSDAWIQNCQCDNSSGHFAVLTGSGDQYNTIQSILIEGCNIFRTRYAGIKLDGVADIEISNCFFNFCYQFGIYTGNTLKNWRINIHDCSFKAGVTGTNGDASDTQQHLRVFSPVSDFKVKKCTFTKSITGDIVGRGITISDCEFNNSGDKGVLIDSEIAILDNCRFYNTGGYPVYAQGKIYADNCKFFNPFVNGVPNLPEVVQNSCIYASAGTSQESIVKNCYTDSNLVAVFGATGTDSHISENNKSNWTYDSYFYVDGFITTLNERSNHPVAPLKLICGLTAKGRTFYGTSYPTSGTYQQGDKIINSNPTVGQPKSWTCTVAGTPGTWVSEGNL